MTPAQMDGFRQAMGVREGREWAPGEGLDMSDEAICRLVRETPFFAPGPRRHSADRIETPGPHFLDDKVLSTQAGFGKILDSLAKSDHPLASRVVTTSPDVTVSTNLGPWVNRRGLFARDAVADTFRDERIPSTQKWAFSPEGQHIELGIAEMNLFLLLGAAGLSHSLFGERLIPVGTLYDPFISRGLDALNYACYQDARFMVVGTPSGVTLAHEGGAHQSVGTPLIGMSQDGLASFEPAWLDELSVIMDWSFDYLQRDGDAVHDERTWLRDETGGSVYLRLSTRALEQPMRREDEAFRRDRWRLLAARAGPELRGGDRLSGCCRAGGDRGGGPHRLRPSRHRRARGDVGRPAQCRLARGYADAQARRARGHEPHRASADETAAPLHDDHRA
jgi:pyruvate dehydrogenase E1 component